MPHNIIVDPVRYLGVMVSSTFTDLKNHREVLIKAVNGQHLKAIAMENDSAKPAGDLIDSSLRMVTDSAAYIGVISHKYGQIPVCPNRNPNGLSLTELEFNESRRLGRPALIFIMGDDHDVKPADVETDSIKIMKLLAFRENVKFVDESSTVHRVYKVFNSLPEFSAAATQAIAELRRFLDRRYEIDGPTASRSSITDSTTSDPKTDPIPKPPNLYARPPYIGAHAFVGRTAHLESLSEWAAAADPHPLLLYEAIGGVGKSMLTWEWTTKHTVAIRDDWAGRFWYSFYEKGATMLDFCRKALVYMTGQSGSIFREKNTAELAELLINHIRARPWLLILDGLERILVSYHRYDAAQISDELAGALDIMAARHPCATVNPEDEDLLRSLAAASPSKILITSRLVPRALLNRSGQPIPGALRERLPGLRPADAELLIRSCQVTGTSSMIQDYLKSHCDCHPLVIGVLAGLITDYLPDRGNFDAWVADPAGGGELNLAKLDLVQKRNHILSYALMTLSKSARNLLATLALLSESVDFPTLCALNPDLPPLPEEVKPPAEPKQNPKWKKVTHAKQSRAKQQYNDALKRYEEFRTAVAERERILPRATADLIERVTDLERRGLLQYDSLSRRYDLHPVVRGFAAGGLEREEINQVGQRVVDCFSQQAQNPYDRAKTLEDFDNARRVVAALFQMGKIERARDFVLKNNFLEILNTKFEAHNEILTILRPFFPDGWSRPCNLVKTRGAISIAKRAAVSLRRICAYDESFVVSELALKMILRDKRVEALASHLLTLSSTAGSQQRLALEDRLLRFAEEVTFLYDRRNDRISFFFARLRQLSVIGDFNGATAIWSRLSANQLSDTERGIALHHYAMNLFFRDCLTEEVLIEAEDSSRSNESALGIRNLIGLRGFWALENGDWQSARENLHQAVLLAHRVGKVDRRSEIRLALANYHLRRLPNPDQIAENFGTDIEGHSLRHLGELWQAIGNTAIAKEYAISAYKWAWADGEPFVHQYELKRTKRLLQQLGIQEPIMQRVKYQTQSWENDLIEFIGELRIKALTEKEEAQR